MAEVGHPRQWFTVHQTRQTLAMGIIQLACGVLTFILGGVALAYPYGSIGYGFFFGVVYIVAGSLGIASARKPSGGLLIASMVLCIFASLSTPIQLGFGLGFNHIHGVHGAMAAFAVIEFVAAIWQAALTYVGSGCCNCADPYVAQPQPQMQVGQVQHLPDGTQVVVVNGAQPGAGVTVIPMAPGGPGVPPPGPRPAYPVPAPRADSEPPPPYDYVTASTYATEYEYPLDETTMSQARQAPSTPADGPTARGDRPLPHRPDSNMAYTDLNRDSTEDRGNVYDQLTDSNEYEDTSPAAH